jgi:16S rRNA (guanine527-N7)-methyltransferase
MHAPTPAARLNQLLTGAGSPPLTEEQSETFAGYLALLQKWNARTNLTAIRDEEGILRRHFLESILCARKLPRNTVSLLDFGSGAGFPGLPIALLRPEIAVTLAESQHKKAAFLREAVRTLATGKSGEPVQVHSGRAETMTQRFECVILRAVDNMRAAIPEALKLLAAAGWLALLTTSADASELRAIAETSAPLQWDTPEWLPIGTEQILLLGRCATDIQE